MWCRRWPLWPVLLGELWLSSTLVQALKATDYVSDEYFPGLHLLDVDKGEIRIYKDCQRPKEGKPTTISTADWKTMDAAREALQVALGIPQPEPLQTPWALFDAQGTRLSEVDGLLGLEVAFLIEIGQWMWPAVRVGFEQEAVGVLEGRPLRLKTLSLRPVVFEVEGFIQGEEADSVIDMGRNTNMFNSEGVLVSADKVSNRPHNDYRTSTQAWLHTARAPVIDALDRRTANLTRVPREHNEEVQLLNYAEGQFYHAHNDWTDLTLYNGQRHQWTRSHFGWEGRMATLFWYLNDVAEGGETVFPKAGSVICPDFGQSCKGSLIVSPKRCDVGLRVSPKKGSVVLWYNYHPNGRGDQNALHGGCPPAKGLEKWSGNKWIHIKSLRTPPPRWMDDHPGLKRFGWRENALEELSGGKKFDKEAEDPRQCKLVVHNEHSERLQLSWINPHTREPTEMGEVEPAGKSLMNSFKGHQFQVSAGNKKSKPFSCTKAMSEFRVQGKALDVLDGAPPLDMDRSEI